MKKILFIPAIIFSVAIISCTNGSKAQSESNAMLPNGKLPNPETAKKNSPDFLPAFAGQTRVEGMKTKTPYSVETLLINLENPWGIINLPDGRFLITSKKGYANIVSKDGKNISKVEGFPKVDTSGQGGLLDIALDADFQNNRMIYFSFSEPVPGGNHTAVGKGHLSSDEKMLENVQVIFRATPTYDGQLHYGSRLAFDKDGNLFVSTGERSDLQTRPLAQKTDVYLGKIIRITKEGKPAGGNPKINGWKPELYSMGHRNPQGTAINPVTEDLWETEMGPRGGDEVNLIKPGKNYGWATITYGTEYSGKKVGAGITQKEGLEQPIYYWVPSVSPSGITFYTGNIEEWKNNLFIGCLSGEKIIRLKIENDKVVGEEWLLADKNERFRDVLNGSDGNLYAITDSGKFYRISKK